MRSFVRAGVFAAALIALWPDSGRAVGGSDTGGCYQYSDTVAPTDGNAPAFDFEDIATTGTVLHLGDEHTSGALPLGFTFNFYGRAYTGVHVSSNGYLGFPLNENPGCCQGGIGDTDEPNGVIAGLWADLMPLPNSVFYETRGTAPNRRFIVQFDGVPYCCSASSDPGTWQTVLYEGTNEIVVQYVDATGFPWSDAGIENNDGTDGIRWRPISGAYTLTAVAVRYFPTGGGDTDGDGSPACIDNCPALANPDQADADLDGVGDACNDASDADGDEVDDALDNCPATPNVDQADGDDDGSGDACDSCTDSDGDGFGNPGHPGNLCLDDNCPVTPNPGQEDSDFDGIGDVCIIRSLLGSTGEWGVIASEKLSVKAGVTAYGYVRFGAYLDGPICTGQAKLATTRVYPDDLLAPSLVATQATGTAVLFKGPGGGDTYGHPYNGVNGTIATGGGIVRDVWTQYPLQVTGVVDTTGSHPVLADCAQSKVDAIAASQALAALPATQTLGRVDVKIGQLYTINAHGGGVIDMEALRLEGAVLGHEYGYGAIKWCDFVDDISEIEINSNEGDQVILNVGQLKIGNCSRVSYNGAVPIVNLPGPGRKVQIGIQATPFDGILAPERTVVVRGSGDDSSTSIYYIWARKALIRGYVGQYSNYGVPLIPW